MARPQTARRTYDKNKRCVLCNDRVADQDPGDCCRSHRTQTTVVQFPTRHVPDQLFEVLELTHTMVMPGGYRRWAGKGEDGRRVIWDEVAS